MEDGQADIWIGQSPFDHDPGGDKGALSTQGLGQLCQWDADLRVWIDLDGVSTTEWAGFFVLAVEELEVSPLAAWAVRVFELGELDASSLTFPEIELEHRAHHTVICADEVLEGFAGLVGADDGADRGEDARGFAGWLGPWRGRGIQKATQAWGFSGDEHRGHALGPDGARIDIGDRVHHREVVDEQAGFKVVCAVEEDVGFTESAIENDTLGVVTAKVGDDGVDLDLGIDFGQAVAGSLGFGTLVLRIGIGEEGLAVEVGSFDEIAVDEGDFADTCAGEEIGRRAPQSAAPDDHRVGIGESILGGLVPEGERELAEISWVWGWIRHA